MCEEMKVTSEMIQRKKDQAYLDMTEERGRLAKALSLAVKHLHPDNPLLHEIDAICSGAR